MTDIRYEIIKSLSESMLRCEDKDSNEYKLLSLCLQRNKLELQLKKLYNEEDKLRKEME